MRKPLPRRNKIARADKSPLKTQLRLLRYVLPHWRELKMILITMALAIGVDVLQPWPMKILVDDILGKQRAPEWLNRMIVALPGPAGDGGLLLWVCIGTVLIYVLHTVVSMANTYATVGLGRRMTYNLGADLFLHLQRLSLKFHSRQPVGDTIMRINEDAYCVQTLVTGAMLPLLQAIISLVTMFFIMWRIEPTLTALALGVAPMMMILIRIFGERLRNGWLERRDKEIRVATLVEQTLSAIPVIQAFTREETEHARFRSYADESVATVQRLVRADLWFRLFVGLTTAVGAAVIMWLGAKYALAGRVSAGDILVFISYLHSLYQPLNSITTTASTVQNAAANANRVTEVLDTEVLVKDAPDARDIGLRGDVRYENVSFSYEAAAPTLRNVSFEAKAGEVVAFVGPSGAGKTTMANLLARFHDPSSGRVTIDGVDIRDIRLRSLREQIAMVLQEPFLFPVTIAENIAFGKPDASREEIIKAAKAANAHDFIARLPGGYDAVIGERGATLSGGEKQRLSIARAFLKDAPILILDEPTSALDAGAEHLLLGALDRLMKDRTTFIIAHRLSTIRNASLIVVMNRGEVAERGRHPELMARNGLYAKLYRQQMEIARREHAATEAAEMAA
ncbi:MAG: putative multidrug export ATP-binding/permease protein [Acidobacteria bacterium]|nr:putative multidrug export ATP-binding/permease protein [Acidobacteriota bacterium]